MKKNFIPQEIARQALGTGKMELTFGQKVAYFHHEAFLAVLGLIFLYFCLSLMVNGKDGALFFGFMVALMGGYSGISSRNKIKSLRFVVIETSLSFGQLKKVINEIISDSIEVECSMSDNTIIMYTCEGLATPGEIVSVVYDNNAVYISSIYNPTYRYLSPISPNNNRNIRVIKNSIREEEEALRIADIHRKAKERQGNSD